MHTQMRLAVVATCPGEDTLASALWSEDGSPLQSRCQCDAARSRQDGINSQPRFGAKEIAVGPTLQGRPKAARDGSWSGVARVPGSAPYAHAHAHAHAHSFEMTRPDLDSGHCCTSYFVEPERGCCARGARQQLEITLALGLASVPSLLTCGLSGNRRDLPRCVTISSAAAAVTGGQGWLVKVNRIKGRADCLSLFLARSCTDASPRTGWEPTRRTQRPVETWPVRYWTFPKSFTSGCHPPSGSAPAPVAYPSRG